MWPKYHFKFNDIDGLKVKGLTETDHANMNLKKVGVAIQPYLGNIACLVPDPLDKANMQ